MIKLISSKVKFLLVSMLAIGIGNPAKAASFTLDANTSDINKLDLGIFASGTSLDVNLFGTISLGESSSFYPDGSLAAPFSGGFYPYAIAGTSGYSTQFGGDGINHFAGGGLNYDAQYIINPFGIAGKETTDTQDADTIRFGSVIGTFSQNPSRNDWFFIGLGRILTVPEGVSNLYVAVNDTYYPNNTGAYSGTVNIVSPSESVPEPLTILGAATALGYGVILKRKSSKKTGS